VGNKQSNDMEQMQKKQEKSPIPPCNDEIEDILFIYADKLQLPGKQETSSSRCCQKSVGWRIFIRSRTAFGRQR